jgi:hypothetical protein
VSKLLDLTGGAVKANRLASVVAVEREVETVRERFLKLIAGNPRWRPAPKSDKGYVIGGAKKT